MEKHEGINLLIKMMKGTTDITVRIMLLQSYIQSYGPVPDEYGTEIRALLENS